MKSTLLDTHALLWWLSDDARLGARSRARIAEPNVRVLVSAASGWEISIKRALGKLEAPGGIGDMLGELGFEPLGIDFAHAEAAGALPPPHRDPFDRMLVAQARVERLVLLTADDKVMAYDVDTADASA